MPKELLTLSVVMFPQRNVLFTNLVFQKANQKRILGKINTNP